MKARGRFFFEKKQPFLKPLRKRGVSFGSDNSLLVFIQQGRVIQRGDPLLLCTVACLLSGEQCLLDDAADQLRLAQAHGG